jgi:hypothetical protein
MTRRVKRSMKRSKRSNTKRSMKRSKRSLKHKTKRSRGGAQGAPLEHAFSGVVLPSDVYRPILKPMNGGACGGDGYAYQASLPAIPMAPMKGRRGKKRSVRRRGKARALGHALPVGHALPPGFGQTVQSFRPL